MSETINGDQIKPVRVWWSDPNSAVTTAAYATLHSGMLGTLQGYTAGNKRCLILLRETAGQNVMYSIDVSLDGINWVNLKTNVDLPANQIAYETLTDAWEQLRTQIIDKVPGTHGAVTETRFGYTIT